MNAIDQLTTLLTNAAEPAPAPCVVAPAREDVQAENDLVQVRMGLGSSLFLALRAKHEPTAHHCFRVGISCSAWAARLQLPKAQRDEIEMAALLHDIGKLTVPDAILQKPHPLTPEEAAVVDRHWQYGIEILKASSANPGVLEILSYASGWYDGSRRGVDRTGEDLPLGARMLSIADAYDAMTTDHVYRRAMSHERACAELYRNAGTQFDPTLVHSFAQSHETDHRKLRQSVARNWLKDLQPDEGNSPWRLQHGTVSDASPDLESLCARRLLESMYDAVVFLDNSLRIIHWNRAAERMTGIPASAVTDRRWSPELIGLRQETGKKVFEAECPIADALQTGVQLLRRFLIRGRRGELCVDAHAMPVVSASGRVDGLTLLLHDASNVVNLVEQFENLLDKVSKDPLTQLANRAEFDRVHEQFVTQHTSNNLPYAMVIADIDRFKSINDTYGHQAGDEVIKAFSALLRRACREGDLVARYGGEEFVMLCSDCDIATAARRAEELRESFCKMPQSWLGGRNASASFGVTEMQSGDTDETMLRRADRALLQAKETGRNRVVQLGGARVENEPAPKPRRWWQRAVSNGVLVEQNIVSYAPLYVCVDKLRGFIADHAAELVTVQDDYLEIKLDGSAASQQKSARALWLKMEIRPQEQQAAGREPGRKGAIRTRFAIKIRPVSGRDRRQNQAAECARQLLVSFRAYLMASPEDPSENLQWQDKR